jgi:hypothetical protein
MPIQTPILPYWQARSDQGQVHFPPNRAQAAQALGKLALWQLIDLPELELCLREPKHPKRMAFHEI